MPASSSIAALLLASTSFFNDGSGSIGVGGTVGLRKGTHPSIRLVEEEIRVKLPERKVRVTFRFRNDGPATRVTMAFPENGYLGGGATEKDLPKARRSNFGYFRTAVDGVPFRARLLKGTTTAEGLGYEHWWVKDVSFAAGQTRVVVNEYQGGGTWGPPWSNLAGFTYVLRTGASWKGGRIGKTRVIVDARAIRENGPVNFSPKGWRNENGIFTWERRNFKPEDDISVDWMDGGFADVVVDGERLYDKWMSGEMAASKFPLPVRRGSEVWMAPALAATLTRAKLGGPKGLPTFTLPSGKVAAPGVDAKGRVSFGRVVVDLGGKVSWSNERMVVALGK
ncbi:MAG: DUF4424 family protein [Fimbriimonas sp.]